MVALAKASISRRSGNRRRIFYYKQRASRTMSLEARELCCDSLQHRAGELWRTGLTGCSHYSKV